MIVRHVTKSCCGSKTFIFETEQPVNKAHLDYFNERGFVTPHFYTKANVFYVQTDGLIATCSFGTRKVHVRCNSKKADQLLATFEAMLDDLTRKV